jgi:hypothetical protein
MASNIPANLNLIRGGIMNYVRTWVKWKHLHDNRDVLTYRPEFEDSGKTRYFNVLAPCGTDAKSLQSIEAKVKRGFEGFEFQSTGMTEYGGAVARTKHDDVIVEVAEIFGPGQHGADFEVNGN